MNKYIIFPLFFASFLGAQNILPEDVVNREMKSVKGPYDENVVREYIQIFHNISQEREVMDDEDIDEVTNPFMVSPKSNFVGGAGAGAGSAQAKPVVTYSLNAILEDRANINNKWYKRYEKINGTSAKLIKIKENSVILKIANKTKEIKLNKGSKNVQIDFQ